nr:hypothetical protein Q903MT_gene3657 [Picea sitchensis]
MRYKQQITEIGLGLTLSKAQGSSSNPPDLLLPLIAWLRAQHYGFLLSVVFAGRLEIGGARRADR